MTMAPPLVVVLVAKFAEGAWVTMLLIPGMLLVFGAVRRHCNPDRRNIADLALFIPRHLDALQGRLPMRTAGEGVSKVLICYP